MFPVSFAFAPNLLTIEALVTDTPLQDVISTWSGETRYGELKRKVSESVSTMLQEFQAKLAEIDDLQIQGLLEVGEVYANDVADEKLLEVQRAVGLR